MSQLLQCIFGKLLDFAFDVLRPNVTNSDSPRVPIRFTSSSEEKILSSITVDVHEKNTAVWLFGTIGFLVNTVIFPGSLTFNIWRGKPYKGQLIFSTTDTAQGGRETSIGFDPTFRNTSFTATDFFKNKHCNKVTYYLTVTSQLTSDPEDPIDVRLIGPITFLAGTIQNK
ncbi:MAG: hypothetical protein GX272_09950 [Epulopiscium sp.]|nr:hypothetical protein [Candidatus Epulonipiscium sp.]